MEAHSSLDRSARRQATMDIGGTDRLSNKRAANDIDFVLVKAREASLRLRIRNIFSLASELATHRSALSGDLKCERLDSANSKCEHSTSDRLEIAIKSELQLDRSMVWNTRPAQ